ncbi:hypothetical protein M433DRAFT_36414, partial [Acidomyces richmondensis BFW]
RYEAYNRAKLKTSDVRRLVNQVLGQSVPANVVLAVSAYTKLFAGELIEAAREVQAEWEAECDRGPLLPDHLREALRRYKKRRG